MTNKSKVTIRDVAKAAGVSTQTVSRVINNRPDVSSETRAYVKKIINDLGYAPNRIAQSLSSGRSNTLGVVGFGLQYFGSASVLTGIERKANELGFSILLTLLDQFDEEKIARTLTYLTARQVEGVIWAIPGFTGTMRVIDEVTKNITVPIVMLNRKSSNSNIVVTMDNHTGGCVATEHLFEQGYKKIGIITGPANWWEAQQRLAGWREVMTEKGISGIDDLIFEGNWEAESGDRGFRTLHAAVLDLDAIFVSNDQMSLGVLQSAHQIGLNIPGDLGIVGFDDIPESSYFIPPLTTIQQGARELGALAVTRLNECIEEGQDEECEKTKENLVTPKLIVRQSSVRN
jgi:DNA-binding LacI/PurR family transcriptional regulator